MGIEKGTKLISPKDRKLLKQFGLLVRQEREKMGLTTFDVTGEDIGIKNRQHWHDIEGGKKNINFTTFFKICRVLEIHPSVMLKNLKIN